MIQKYEFEKVNKEDQEKEIENKFKEFENDYDLNDMKINDRIVLRQLIQAIISLEHLETVFIRTREDITEKNILVVDRISQIMNKLRADISKMQDDLKLTRKIRKESQEENFITWLDNTKKKAEVFYKQKHLFILCPKCKTLLSTVWLLYPDNYNVLHLKCGHKDCLHEFDIKLSELYDKGNKNLQDILIS
jgi:hypothetical protein